MAIRRNMNRPSKADYSKHIRETIDSLEVDEELNKTFSSSVGDPDHAVQFEDFFSDDEPEQEDEFDEEELEAFEEEEEEVITLASEELVNEDEEHEFTDQEIEAYLSQVSLKDDGKSGTSFSQLMPKKKARTGIRMQHKQRKVHNLLTLRELVELTPSVCKFEHCMYDAADKAGFQNWHKVPKSKQRLVQSILQKHVKEEHKYVNHTIIDKADVQGFWLSSNII